jgi:hypothetical protein
MSSPISGPIPPYANLPIEPQNYQPRRFQISDITRGITTVITTTANMDYVISQQVRVLIPNGYGCTQISGKDGFVISIPSPNQVEVTINSTKADPFVNTSLAQVPQILAIGNIENGQTNTGRTGNITYTPGSFINISPK